MKVLAHFMLSGDERESREVDDEWLNATWSRSENILLQDGNTYRIVDVRYSGEQGARCAHVELAAPTFVRGS